MAANWLTQRWDTLFPALAQAATEAEVKAICQAEIDAWRARKGMKKENSLRNPMNDTRNEIKRRLAGERQMWALTYLAFSEAWYRQHNAPSRAGLEDRLEHQQLLKDPDAIVSKAIALLSSEQWPDLVVALGVLTGRRPGEALKTAMFELKTMYSVIFSGQLKRRDEPLPPYEIPTLCEARAVIDALARLRAMLDTTGMDVTDATRKYSPLVQEAANKHFATLIPARYGKDGLYGHLFRSVYPRIAVFWYCPPTIADMHFMATIQGHTQYFEQETEEARRSYASNAHYSDYKIADAQGNIDGRQGLKLGAKGVELLEVFKPKPRRKEPMSTDTQTQDQAEQTPVKEGKNVPVTVDRPTFNRVQALRSAKSHRTYSETLNLLLDIYEQGGQPISAGELTPERIVPAETASMVREALTEGEDFRAFLISALTKEAKFREGLGRRHEGKDFAKLTLAQLAKTRDPRATNERIRRAVAAIAAYNDDPARAATERWYLNATTIHKLVGGRFPIIGAYIKEHQEEIAALNDKHDLNERYNSKPYYVDSVVTVPDEPPDAAPEQEAEQPETATMTE